MGLAGLLALLCAAVPLVGAAAEAGPPLVLEETIILEHTRGRIDHMAVDLRRRRLFVAELANGTVDAGDFERGNVTAQIDGLREPQGVGHADQTDLVVVTSAGDGTVRFYRGDDLSPTGMVSLGDEADNVRIAMTRPSGCSSATVTPSPSTQPRASHRTSTSTRCLAEPRPSPGSKPMWPRAGPGEQRGR